MKILALSDTHSRHNDIYLSSYTNIDLIVFAGDWTGSVRGEKENTKDFLRWFSNLSSTYKILIAGNHELKVEDDPEYLLEALTPYPNIIYLQDTSIVIEGIKFHGSPYANNFYDWAFMTEENELSKIWDKIPENTQVLITHGPAYGHLDTVVRNNTSVGSKTLTNRKKHLTDLKLHICGHIHEASGILEVDNHTVINASQLNEHYKLVNKPIEITV